MCRFAFLFFLKCGVCKVGTVCVVAVHAMHVDSPLGYPSWSGTSTQHTVSTSGLRGASWNQRTSGIPLVVAYILSSEHTPLY
jgi:hypothetical protein